eukprot:CAMPEP_0204579380 /NCGR_PEP_ID=MMETSP0661-20131031/43458_1 /ASSEMBLY_ACC=CAM_ASM_000606 /TAXON_ID=109239 /ORGANISM="Alexandrium margalefi, Strain AMGDE01CS-322" /LENGTH=110 /DNA_ID=CAMNT_0051588387 /DNA_START=24 /DNA_END=353 /DNA_ORIENTATION=+
MEGPPPGLARFVQESEELRARVERLELESAVFRRCMQSFSKREGHVNDLQRCIEKEMLAHAKRGDRRRRRPDPLEELKRQSWRLERWVDRLLLEWLGAHAGAGSLPPARA